MICPFCGSKNVTIISHNMKIYNRWYFNLKNSSCERYYYMDICCCRDCGYGFYSNVLLKNDLETLYENYEFVSPFVGLSVNNYYENNIELVKKYLSHEKFIMEIGCSEGYFLHLLNKNGYKNNLGIEPSKHALIGIERGLNIKKLFFAEDVIEKEHLCSKKEVDAFVLLHTFEHFSNPFDIFKTMADYIKDDGLIFVETPNFSSFTRGHLSYFSWPFYEKMAHYYNMKIIDVDDGDENISLVFARNSNETYREIVCPYNVDVLINKVNDRLNDEHVFFQNIIIDIKKHIQYAGSVIIWGTKVIASKIIDAIPDMDAVIKDNHIEDGVLVGVIPVDSYKERKDYRLEHISHPTVSPEDIAGSYFDLVIITTEFIEEVKKTMMMYNISCGTIIHAVEV